MKSYNGKERAIRALLGAALLLSLSGCTAENPQSPESGLQAWPKVASPAADPQIEQRVETLLARMSLEEKVGQIMQAEIQSITPEEVRQYHIGSVLNGGGSMPNRNDNASVQDWLALADAFYEASADTSGGRTGIPIFWGTDAVHGNGNLIGATLFPHNIGLGAARNPQLIREIGKVTAREVRTTGVEWVFAPTLAVAQNGLWGRTYESYSEDPQLVRDYAAAMVEGLQGAHGGEDFLGEERVIATAKHFLADGGTHLGSDQGDARISERELIDIHNPGYPAAIESGVQTIMASFSSWNGEKVHGSRYLLTEVLKERMGFDGLVVGDWNGHGQVPGCTNDSCAQAINAGIDLLMVTYDWKKMIEHTLAQVRAGEVSEARLDDAVRRILRVKLRAGLFDKKPSERAFSGRAELVGHPEHRALARRAVRESLVLLKNRERLLPLHPKQTILVAGPGADSIAMQAGGWSVSWQGAGIPNEKFPGATSIYTGIKDAVEQAGGSAILSEDGSFDEKPHAAVVVFGEPPYAEGAGDLETLEFEAGDKQSLALLQSLQAKGIPVVSVFLSGRPLWVNPELNASDAFVSAWLPGTEGAGVADLLIAGADGKPRYDFSGKLSFSWPQLPQQAQLNLHHADYAPLFTLGYGLDYTAGKSGPGELAERVPGRVQGEPQQFELYAGRPLKPWRMSVRDGDYDQILSGSYVRLPSGRATLVTRDKERQEDALAFNWRDTWFAEVSLRHGKPLDLSDFIERGSITFDLKVNDLAGGDLSLAIDCGENCERRLDITLEARTLAGKGWQRKSFKLSCLVDPGESWSQVSVPFALRAGGQGEVEVANIRLLRNGESGSEAESACPHREAIAVTPAERYEYWATTGWWEERRARNLERLSQGNVEILMLGDSITEGWEGEGKSLWERLYAPRGAVNLGYGGDKTENLLWRLQNGELDGISPKAAVVMIGTNNTGHRLESPEFTAAGIRAVLDELRVRQPQMKILLLGIFPRDPQPGTPMRKINSVTNGIVSRYADNENIFYLDIGDRFLTEDGKLTAEIMPDYLHLSERGYQIWAEAMAPALERLME